MTDWNELGLTQVHEAMLREAAISAEVAAEAGVRSARRTADLPPEHRLRGTAVLPALVFPWNRVNGSPVVTQIRPDEPETGPDGEVRKYLFPTGAGPVLACHPAMRERVLDASAPIVVVEGTKQYLAACTVLRSAAQAAVGIAGCWGWSSQGQPSADMEEIPWDDREVFLCFDADVRAKRNVYDAAQALTDILTARGAASVRYVLVPGRGNAGLDDALAPVRDPVAFMQRIIASAPFSLGRAPARPRDRGQFFDQDGSLLAKTLADSLRADVQMATTEMGSVAVYSGGVYLVDRTVLPDMVRDRLTEAFRPGHRATIVEYITLEVGGEDRKLSIRTELPLLNCTNGMLDLRTLELHEHSPAYLSAQQIPVAWDRDAKCPQYEAWLESQAGTQADDLEEVAGTMLDPTRTPARAIFLYGPSRSGKGTFLRILKAIAGDRNTSTASLHQLCDNKFIAATLYSKMLNTSGDLSAAHVRDVSTFKMLSGEDAVSAENKHEHPFTFTSQALFAFSANNVPTVSENSAAYSNRIKPFRFTASFQGREDPGIEDAMMAELPGILVRWVTALQRLRERGEYLPTDDGARREFEASSDRVHRWVIEECQIVTRIPDKDGPAGSYRLISPGQELPAGLGTTKRDLHQMFRDWVNGDGSHAMSYKTFTDRLTCIEGVHEVRLLPNRVRALNVIPRPDDGGAWPDDTSDDRASRATRAEMSPGPIKRVGLSTEDQLVGESGVRALKEVSPPRYVRNEPEVARAARTDGPEEDHPDETPGQDGSGGPGNFCPEDARKLPEAARTPDPGITPVQAGCALTFDLETADAGDLFTYRPYDETGFIRLAGMITPGGGPEIVPVPELVNHLNAAGEIRGHNILGFDGLALAFHAGLDWEQFAAKAADTELIARQADPPRSRESGSSEDRYGLTAVAERLGLPGKTDDLPRLKRKHGGYDKIPLDDPEFRAYLEGDLAATAAVADALPPDDYTRREHQVAAIAGRMTLNGFMVDVPLLRERQRELADRKAAALDQLATGYGLPLAKTVMRGRGKARHEETEALTAPLAAASGREWLAGIYERYGCTNPPRTSHGELAIGRDDLVKLTASPEVPG